MGIPLGTLALEVSRHTARSKISIRALSSDQDVNGSSPLSEPDGPTDDNLEVPAPDDDAKWDAFLPDDNELDPLPDPGDFWIDPD